MESALAEARQRFHQANENGSPSATPIAEIATPLDSSPSAPSSTKGPSSKTESSHSVVRSLFKDDFSASSSTAGTTDASMQASTNIKEQNVKLLNEILHEGLDLAADGGLHDPAESEIKARVRDIMERAFWDGITESLSGDNPNYSRILALVKEVRDELCQLTEKWKQEIFANMDIELLSQLFESGFRDASYLGKILEYALTKVQLMAAEAKEAEMRQCHQNLLRELAEISQVGGNDSKSFVIAVVKGLRFVLEEIKTLKRDISKARVELVKSLLKGSAGSEEYLQVAFGERYGPPSNARVSLPVAAEWVSSVRNAVEEEWSQYVHSLSLLPSEIAQPLVGTLRTGRGTGSMETSTVASDSSALPECSGERLDKLLRLGILHLVSGAEGLTELSVPETLKLNALRLRIVQSQYQQVVVIATSMLVLRQTLAGEKSKMSSSEIEAIVAELVKRLMELFRSGVDAGIDEILEVMMSCSPPLASVTDLESRKELMTRVLLRSLQNDDAVFKLISRAIYTSFRGVVLGGAGAKGKKLAELALRRVGAALVVDLVVKGSEVMIRTAMKSVEVHGPWYRNLL